MQPEEKEQLPVAPASTPIQPVVQAIPDNIPEELPKEVPVAAQEIPDNIPETLPPEPAPQTAPGNETPQHVEGEPHPLMHTYTDDLSKAMNATDANVVQELLSTAREREASELDEKVKTKERAWYVTGSIVLLLVALCAAAYATYHYITLTVPVQKPLSVGVFGSTDPIIAPTTDIRKTIAELQTKDLPEGKPLLVPLVYDQATLAPLAKDDFFSFIEADATEPFIASLETVRLGIVNTGSDIATFIIASTNDPVVTSKRIFNCRANIAPAFLPNTWHRHWRTYQ